MNAELQLINLINKYDITMCIPYYRDKKREKAEKLINEIVEKAVLND